PEPASDTGSTWTRTAGCCPPPTKTCPTPRTWAIFWARTVLADSNTSFKGRDGDVSERIRIGESAGFTFRYVGRVGRLLGRAEAAAAIAAWMSRAAPSTSRFRSNWRVMFV